MAHLAFDIGGANIKVADGQGYAANYPFALWRDSAKLAEQLRAIITASPTCSQVAATMTGELADCFGTKAEGVRFILAALVEAAAPRAIRIYLGDGRFVTPDVARQHTHLAAAANWHALAKYASRFIPPESPQTHPSLLIDIGSTTSDIIPMLAGEVVAWGTSDTTRLLQRELVYTGVERTPVCALVAELPYRGQLCPIAREFFATSYDAYLLLGQLPENPHDLRTADGRSATREHASVRLGRMIAADEQEFNSEDALAIASAIEESQLMLLNEAVQHVLARFHAPLQAVILSGQGEFLAQRLLRRLPPAQQVVSLSHALGVPLSQCAPAHAVAVLAREQLGT